ncbi:hypothetical protein GQ54DRAFT_251035, partial [Martensiomyces pterosporus]
WLSVLAVLGVAAVGGTLFWTSRYLKADHERTMRLRDAKKKYKELVAELSECKGILNYMDTQMLPQAQQLADEANAVQEKTRQRLDAINRQLLGIGEQLLRLMERIDGVAPAHVLDAAGMEPWAEHDEDLRRQAAERGLGPVFDLTGDLRAIRKGLVRKAERRAQKVDGLRK